MPTSSCCIAANTAFAISDCGCRPPLCLAVQHQSSLDLVKYLLVPCKQQRALGVDEQEKGKSALGFTMQMQAAQNEDIVRTVS